MRPLLAQRGCTIAPDVRLRTLAEVIEYLGVDGRTGIIDGHGDPCATPGRRPQGPGHVRLRKTKQNAVKSMVRTDAEGRMLFCCPARPGSRAGITQDRQLGPVQLLAGGPFHGDPRGCRLPEHGSADRRPVVTLCLARRPADLLFATPGDRAFCPSPTPITPRIPDAHLSQAAPGSRARTGVSPNRGADVIASVDT
ncbi:hypothetical protein JCM4814A_80670 [Streptomyces phaeofaciens JCM 4814]|uniref:Transposase n=1 Tax=Streptomyces phaeofaciens TaxID=68254 RepID=A0A918HRN2_9ACTN|nr:hypothetical protein GCM10010226_86290 [Streptomyces phaeofaciens]